MSKQQAIGTLGIRWAAIRYAGCYELNSCTCARAICVVRNWRAAVGKWKGLRMLHKYRLVILTNSPSQDPLLVEQAVVLGGRPRYILL